MNKLKHIKRDFEDKDITDLPITPIIVVSLFAIFFGTLLYVLIYEP